MRTYIWTLVTLDTVFRNPLRNLNCNASLFKCRWTLWEFTVSHILECWNRKLVALLSITWDLNIVYIVCKSLVVACNSSHTHLSIGSVSPWSRDINLYNVLMTCINSIPVLFYDILTLLAVRSFSSCLHIFNSVLKRNDVGKLEECGLKNSINSCTHTCFFTQLNTVDCIEIDVILSKVSLNLTRKMLFKTFHIPDSIQKESTAWLDVGNHIVLVDIALVMTGNKVSLVNEICRLDRCLTETQVRNCYTAWFLWVVWEVSLSVQISMVADDLDRVLVSTYSTVRTETPELTCCCTCRSSVRAFCNIKWKICNVIIDADCKSWLCCIIVYSDDLFRSCILWTQTVSACKYWNIVEFSTLKSCNNVKVKRFAQWARFLSSVKNWDSLYWVRNSFNKLVCNERSVKSNLNKTVLAAVSVQVIYSFFNCIVNRTHSNNYVFCVSSAVVVEELVVCTKLSVNLVHIFFNDCRHIVIVWITCFSCLEEDVRILSSTS